MEIRQFCLLHEVVSLKKDILDLVITIQNEKEGSFSRNDIIKDLIERVKDCSTIEEMCYQDQGVLSNP